MAKAGRRITVILDPEEVNEYIRRTNAVVEAVALDFVQRTISPESKEPIDVTRVTLESVNELEHKMKVNGKEVRAISEVEIDIFVEDE